MNSRSREELREESSDIRFDVAIIGAGINGASLYHELCGRGYRVLLPVSYTHLTLPTNREV